jgi:tRNA threonylcarbamoyladenosine biosynthesis protein TsaB
MQVFGPGGRAAIPPRLAALGEAVEAARSRAPALITGSAADLVAAQWPADEPTPRIVAASAPDIAWVARLGAAAEPDRALPKPLYLRPPDARPQDAARIARQ